MHKRAFVLHSGGIDSTVCLAEALRLCGVDDTISIGVDYGQRHARELEAANEIAAWYGVPRQIIQLGTQPKSMLTDSASEVPNARYEDLVGVSPTYVHFRNGQLLSAIAAVASAWACEEGGYNNPDRDALIFFGAHADDAAGDAYPDCSIPFISAMRDAIRIGTYGRVGLVAPLATIFKADIIKHGVTLGAPLHLTWSCYKGEKVHCGVCPTCRQRREGFVKAGITDQTVYAQ